LKTANFFGCSVAEGCRAVLQKPCRKQGSDTRVSPKAEMTVAGLALDLRARSGKITERGPARSLDRYRNFGPVWVELDPAFCTGCLLETRAEAPGRTQNFSRKVWE